MGYKVVKRINISKENARKVGPFLYTPDNDGLFFESPGWPFPVQLYVVKGLSEVYVTKGMVKLPFILKGWINLDILMREIELLKLVIKDRILMHASCVDDTLIVGLPNSGKTYETFTRLRAGKGLLVSEEYTIIEKGVAAPYKKIMRSCFSRKTIRDCGISMTLNDRIWLRAMEVRAALMPFMFEGVIWKELPVSGQTREIKKIVYGSTGEEVKSWKAFAILCENEFPFMASEFLQAYGLASGLDMIGIQNKQRNLIKEFVHAVYPPTVA